MRRARVAAHEVRPRPPCAASDCDGDQEHLFSIGRDAIEEGGAAQVRAAALALAIYAWERAIDGGGARRFRDDPAGLSEDLVKGLDALCVRVLTLQVCVCVGGGGMWLQGCAGVRGHVMNVCARRPTGN